MAFTKKTWTDRVAEYINRRVLNKTDGTQEVVTVERSEGDVSVEGDAFNAANMNDLEDRIEEAIDGLKKSVSDGKSVVDNIINGSQVVGRATNADKLNGKSFRLNHNTTDTWIPVMTDSNIDYILKSEISVDNTARNTANNAASLLTNIATSSIFMTRDGCNNANDCLNNGIYSTWNGSANIPISGYGMLIVFRTDANGTGVHGSSWIWQIWTPTSGSSVYMRRNINYTSSGWSGWDKLH